MTARPTKKIQIELSTCTCEVEAEIYGVFAVHRLLSDNKFWTLTHIPTSLEVIKTKNTGWNVSGLRSVARKLAHLREDLPLDQVYAEVTRGINTEIHEECVRENARNGYL